MSNKGGSSRVILPAQSGPVKAEELFALNLGVRDSVQPPQWVLSHVCLGWKEGCAVSPCHFSPCQLCSRSAAHSSLCGES